MIEGDENPKQGSSAIEDEGNEEGGRKTDGEEGTSSNDNRQQREDDNRRDRSRVVSSIANLLTSLLKSTDLPGCEVQNPNSDDGGRKKPDPTRPPVERDKSERSVARTEPRIEIYARVSLGSIDSEEIEDSTKDVLPRQVSPTTAQETKLVSTPQSCPGLQEQQQKPPSPPPSPTATNISPYNVYNANVVMSTMAVANKPEEIIRTPPPYPPPSLKISPPPLSGAPPSYSATMRIATRVDSPSLFQEQRRFTIGIQHSIPFVPPIPPPTYAEAQGLYPEARLGLTVDQVIFGPEPMALICPRCTRLVVTYTRSHRSNFIHFTALGLCLCGCWPCCLIPYCIESCKNTHHYCPQCQQFLGIYRPW